MSQILFADRSDRAKLRVADEQRLWFLDQILTQSFGDMQPGDARDTALITVHGRMQAYMEAVATEDALLLHYEPELREVVLDTLGKYVFATRVTLEDATERTGLILLVGADWRSVGGGLGNDAVLHETQSLGVEAGYLWLAAEHIDDALEQLRGSGATEATEEDLEAIRIANGVARWGRDMDPKTFPQEAGVDALAVHYEKGCYLGQEAMAKIHFRGKVNRRLVRLDAEGPLTPGEELYAGEERVGKVTSASNGRGLALVKRGTEEGTELSAGSTPARVVS